MSTRLNLLILATVVGATFAVGLTSAGSTTSIETAGKSDRLFSANLAADGLLTVEYRGENLSVLARVPLAP